MSPDDVRRSWETIAGWWDSQVGEGNAMQRDLVWPAAERLLGISPGMRVWEVACGNGSFARRMAGAGASVLAVDLTDAFIEIARRRTVDPGASVEFRRMDVTSPTELDTLEPEAFDAVVCLMGMMDMPTIEPLLGAARRVLRRSGRFVFAVLHPCFNGAGVVRAAEESDTGAGLETVFSVRVSRYATPSTTRGVGIIGQPAPHFYFDRPIAGLLASAFRAGFVVDGWEEPVMAPTSQHARPLSWSHFTEIPPALVVRLRPDVAGPA